MTKELSAAQVRKKCDSSIFDCDSTEQMEATEGIIGQDRALKALNFGLNIPTNGFNIFVSGPAGTGRTTAIKSFLDAIASEKPTPPDWCYVYNFADPYYPKSLRLPAGMGMTLHKDMKHVIDSAQKSINQAFSSKEYADRRAEITEGLNKKKEAIFNNLSKKAEERGFLLRSTPVGLVFLPATEGKPITEEEYEKLSDDVKEEMKKKQEELTKDLKEQIARLRTDEDAVEKELEDTDRQVARYSISHLFDEMRNKYAELPQVIDYLNAVADDMVENFEQFKSDAKAEANPLLAMQAAARQQSLRKYEINVLVDNSGLEGAPVILELNPTFNNLIGRIDKEAQFGALITDFTMIKSGSLHRACGGYLVVRIEDILSNFQAWQGLKRTLRDGKLEIEDLGERLGYLSTKSLRPESIPLDTKAVVIGEPIYYYLLFRLDPDFKELFKVKADFDTRMEKSDAYMKKYASVICSMCQKENIRHLTSGALSKIIEHSSRMANDQEKLSVLFADIADIIREANFWAGEDDSKLIDSQHVEKSIEEKVYRSNLIQQRINEMIENGTIIIDIDGEKTGQVNGLEVLDLGDFAFGKPARITTSTGVGREGLVDIEREAKLGGRIHSKGVMILSGYITDKYTQNIPLSLSARLVFEQSYEEVEGDSASSTELYALLSALADAPIKQGIAVTGSVNQKGQVQAIGGVNEKVEGFFEICKSRGLDGKQGVLIPAANLRNLMLKEDVVEAVDAGSFHIYPVSTIEEGIEVLTGVKAGKRRADGTFEPGTINDRVQKRLQTLAERLRDFSKGEEKNRNARKKSKSQSEE